MLTLQQEFVYMVREEVAPLLARHYDELTLHKDVVKLDPDWERYGALERAGVLQVFTAREDGALVGYAAFFIQPHLHYLALTAAINDVLYVDPAHRGSIGVRLVKFCERELKAQGAKKIVWHAKLATPLIALLERLDYQVEEVMLGKIL